MFKQTHTWSVADEMQWTVTYTILY